MIKNIQGEKWKQLQFDGYKSLRRKYAVSSMGRAASYSKDLNEDGKILNNLDDNQFAELTDFFTPAGINDFPPYKGFNFKIKVEENKSFEVKGNKRRYAVAINRDGVEQIKSDYSFTQDPNDLVEQLKLVIDQRNLQG